MPTDDRHITSDPYAPPGAQDTTSTASPGSSLAGVFVPCLVLVGLRLLPLASAGAPNWIQPPSMAFLLPALLLVMSGVEKGVTLTVLVFGYLAAYSYTGRHLLRGRSEISPNAPAFLSVFYILNIIYLAVAGGELSLTMGAPFLAGVIAANVLTGGLIVWLVRIGRRQPRFAIAAAFQFLLWFWLLFASFPMPHMLF